MQSGDFAVTTRREALKRMGAGVLATAAMPFHAHPDTTNQTKAVTGAIFTPVKPPAWVGGVTRMTFCGPDEVERAARTGAQVVHGNALWPYYPLRSEGGKPKANEADALRRFAENARRHKVRFVLGLPPFPSVEHVRAHPDWRVLPKPAARLPEPKEDDLGGRIGCNNGPWGDYLIEICVELMRDFGLDGYSFDGNYHAPICYCPHCRERYRAERGRDLPGAVNLRDVAYCEYLVWRGEKLEAHFARLQQQLKAANPDAVVMTWTANAGRYGHFLTSPRVMSTRMNQLIDLPMQEWWLDETNLGASLLPAFGVAYLRAVTGDRACASEPYMMTRGNPYGSDSFPRHERMTRAMLALTYGSVSAESLGWPGHGDSTAEIFQAVAAREPWITNTRRVPWAALLVSEQTRQFSAWEDIPKRFLPPPLGWFRAASETHLPLDLINDWDLTVDNLAPYRVLVLPDAAALSDAQIAAIRTFVSGGGGLICSNSAAWADELGRPRPQAALMDLLGIKQHQTVAAGGARPQLDVNFAIALDEKYWRERVGVARVNWNDHAMFASAKLRELVPMREVNFRGNLTGVLPLNEAEVVAWFRSEADPGQRWPAMLARSVGPGRVAYFAAGMDAGFWSYGYPYQREILAGALRWADGKLFPVEVEAPMCVQVTYFRPATASESRLIVHCCNTANSTAHHGLPEADVPLREESLPIRGIKLHFIGPKPGAIYVEPGHHAPEIISAENRTTVLLPELDRHFLVSVEGLSCPYVTEPS